MHAKHRTTIAELEERQANPPSLIEDYLEVPVPMELGKEWTVPLGSGVQRVFKVISVGSGKLSGQTLHSCVTISYRLEGPGGITQWGYYVLAPSIGRIEEVKNLGTLTIKYRLDKYVR